MTLRLLVDADDRLALLRPCPTCGARRGWPCASTSSTLAPFVYVHEVRVP